MQRTSKVIPVEKKNIAATGTDNDIVRPIRDEDTVMKNSSKLILGVYGLLILLGIGTGYLLSGKASGTGSFGGPTPAVVKTGNVVGSTDVKTFKDSAQGTLQKGGFEDEGSYQLIRDGGPSQTVYLISSVVDLDQFVGKKVKVWGQTMAAKKVAWLMDVGKVELLSQ